MAERSPFSRIGLLVAALLSVIVVIASGSGDSSLSSTALWSKSNAKSLPIFFFHGITENASVAANYAANLTAEDHVFTALSFCSDLCTLGPLANQAQLAIAQIRRVVVNDSRYDNGYIFIGYSQGGLIARAVIEKMDDHKVHSFVSLAGAQSGVFSGSLLVFVSYSGALLLPKTLFDFTKYTAKDYAGKLQRDFDELTFTTPALQQQLSLVNMGHSPDFQDWVKTNTFLSLHNSINECKLLDIKCTLEKARRRRNFLKLQAFHLFTSEGDDVVSPWQTSLLAQYNNVNSLNEIGTKFASLQIANTKQTLEYTLDTYGLRTLDVLGHLHLRTIPKICHLCWVNDSIPVAGGELCKFRPLYDQCVYPVLKDSPCGKSF
ncbi:Lysosomal thioesterase ppt2, partial [Globisporangium splendens]